MPKSRLLAFIIKELKELLPPTVFFAISFNLLVLTTQLILSDRMNLTLPGRSTPASFNKRGEQHPPGRIELR